MKICVITDDNSGFTKEEANKLGIKIIRMPIIINGECYYENETITSDLFYRYLEENKDISTSQPSPGEILKMRDETLKEYDAIIYIPMSSGLSQSCQSALMLAQDYENKVFVVDNHRISLTLKQSVYDCLNLIKLGKKPLEIKHFLERTKSESVIFIMVDTLKYLKKGGRITASGAALGATFHIKPVLTILGGKLDAYAKCVGVKKSKLTMLNAIDDLLNTQFKDTPVEKLDIGIAYTYDINAANIWKKEVQEHLKIKNVRMDPLSLSVATHIGPGALAITISRKY